MPEPFRLHRSARFVDQRERIFCASVTAHFISRRTEFPYMRSVDDPLRVRFPHSVHAMFNHFASIEQHGGFYVCDCWFIE